MGLCCSINTRSIYTVHWYRQVRLQITTLDIIAVQFVVVVALSNREPQNHIWSMSMTRWDLCKIHNVIVYMYIIHLISSLLLCRGNTTGATCGTWTAFPPGAHEYTPVCSVVRVAPPIVFCVMDCRSLFLLLVTLLHVFVRFTAYDYTYLWSVSVDCICGLYLWTVSVVCICGLSLWFSLTFFCSFILTRTSYI
jgi:hypothetical protein